MTNLPISKEQAIELLKKYPQEKSDMNHYLESGAVMKQIAKTIGEDEEYYEMLGLLHDVDWSLTKNDWTKHTVEAEKILEDAGFDKEFIRIVQSHAYHHDGMPLFASRKRTEKVDFILTSAETITGIVHAYALMRGGKIEDMEVSGLKKKFKDKNFAAGCDRERIREIEQAGITLDDLFKTAIEGIKNIKEQVGLV